MALGKALATAGKVLTRKEIILLDDLVKQVEKNNLELVEKK